MRGLFIITAFSLAGCAASQKPPQSVADVPVSDASVSTMETVDTLTTMGVQLLGSGRQVDAARAVELFEQVLQMDGGTATSKYNLAVAHHRAGNATDAIRMYDATLGMEPSWLEAELHAARLLAQDGRYRGALMRLRRAIEQDPENLDLRVGLVDVYRLMGDHQTAISEAKQALSINANSIELYRSMGATYVDQGELMLARFVLQKALDTLEGARNHAGLHESLGSVYQLEDKLLLARAFYERALEIDPSMFPSRIHLSELHMKDRNYEEAVTLLEFANARRPDDPGLLITLGVAYRGVGRVEDAVSSYKAALQSDPGFVDAWFNLGIVYGDSLKDYSRSISAFEQYIEMSGSESELASTYIKDIEREQKRADRRNKAEEDRKRREAERAERQRLIEQTNQNEDAQNLMGSGEE
jgi:tetratricopeptide (TPR) repeat protein